MKTENQTIACPHCGEEIDVNSVLTHQIEETIRQDFIQKENQVKKDFALKNDALQKQIEAFENEKQKNDAIGRYDPVSARQCQGAVGK